MMDSLLGIPVVESPILPLSPGDGTVARRIVRHGMADVLRWLGEDVGPKPYDQTHVLLIGQTIHASAAIVGRLRNMPEGGDDMAFVKHGSGEILPESETEQKTASQNWTEQDSAELAEENEQE